MKSKTLIQYGYHAGGLAVCGAILVAFYLFAYLPLSQSQHDLALESENTGQLAGKRDVVLKRIQTLGEKERQLIAELEELTGRIAVNAREDELLRAISQAARTCNTQLVDFQPSGASQFDGLPTSIVRISLRGRYARLCQFLDGLQTSGRLHRISQITLQAGNRATGEFDLRLEIHRLQKPVTPPRQT